MQHIVILTHHRCYNQRHLLTLHVNMIIIMYEYMYNCGRVVVMCIHCIYKPNPKQTSIAALSLSANVIIESDHL
jgi:hypothetical protein